MRSAVGERGRLPQHRGECHVRSDGSYGHWAFEVTLDMDMFKDIIVNHRLPMQSVLSAQVDAGMTPGQVAMTPYDSNSLMIRCFILPSRIEQR